MPEAGDETLVGVFQGQFGFDAEFARHVHGGEEDVADFVLQFFRVTRAEFDGKLGQFLAEFVDDSGGIGPVETDAGGLLLDVGRADEGRQGARDTLHDRGLCTFFLPLDLLPLAEDGLGVGSIDVPEDVGMPADELFAGVAGGILQGKGTAFGGQIRMEDDLKKKVAEFFAQVGVIGLGDGVDCFAGLLEKTGAQRCMGLLPVPRAALGGAEQADDGAEAGEGFLRKVV